MSVGGSLMSWADTAAPEQHAPREGRHNRRRRDDWLHSLRSSLWPIRAFDGSAGCGVPILGTGTRVAAAAFLIWSYHLRNARAIGASADGACGGAARCVPPVRVQRTRPDARTRPSCASLLRVAPGLVRLRGALVDGPLRQREAGRHVGEHHAHAGADADLFTISGGASLPSGVARLPTTRRASCSVGLPFWVSRSTSRIR